jgi:hypothetical protein
VLVRTAAGPVAWLGRTLPEGGRWLSRRIDPATGEGVRLALRGMEGLLVILDGSEALHGLLLVARAEPGLRVAALAPVGARLPEGVQGSGWALLSHGFPWGAGEPLYDRWATAGRLGRVIAVGDPGLLPVVPMAGLAAAGHAILGHPGAQWSWPGEPTRFPTLAADLVGEARVAAAWMPDRWAGPAGEAARLRRWIGRPGGSRATPGWDPPAVAADPPV